MKGKLSRREFLQMGVLGLATGLHIKRLTRSRRIRKAPFPTNQRLGRVVVDLGQDINVRSFPSTDAANVGSLAGDDVVPWHREVVGESPYRNQRWVETPLGYVWSPFLQPVENRPNSPIEALPNLGQEPGFWAEVTVPYVTVSLANEKPFGPRISYLIENRLPIRFYYGQIMWVDEIEKSEQDNVLYHIRELHGSYGDHFWAPADGFRLIDPEELSPISSQIEDKVIQVDLSRQTLSCFEEGREVFFTRISSGSAGKETPTGNNLRIFWKLVSVHMSGGTAGAGYDLAGVAWPTFFAAGGIAIHGTFWHNNYGERTSAGCVNATPEAAKFVSRWSNPRVPYYPGEVDVGGTIEGTMVQVFE